MATEFDLGDIEFSSAVTLAPRMKATVHKNGSLGFNTDAIRGLNLKVGMGVQLGQSRSNPDPLLLFMKIMDKATSESFKMNKAGSYYYVRTKPYFDSLELPYTDGRIIYDLHIKTEAMDAVVVEMKGRKKIKKAA